MNLNWRKIGKGIWRTRSKDDYVPLIEDVRLSLDANELEEEMDDNDDSPFHGAKLVRMKKLNGSLLSFPLEEDETLYGLGMNFKCVNIRKKVFELKVDHYSNRDTGHTHAPVPFYVSSGNYGIFINVSERLKMYMGSNHPQNDPHPPVADRLDDGWQAVALSRCVEVFVPNAGYDVFLFKGETMMDVVRKFNMLCGGGCLPPKWGLGFWHRVPIGYTAKDVLSEVDAFEKHEIPLQVVGLEPGWHSYSYPCTYEFSDRFPDPAGMMSELKKRGVRVNLWENCMVHPDCELAEKLGDGVGDYYAGWGGLVPDLEDDNTCEAFCSHHEKKHLKVGVSGYKLDECDGFDQWLWPDHAMFGSGLSGAQIRQKYGVLYQRMYDSMFRKRDQRTYGLARASNAGGASFPFVLYNDCYDHRDYINGMVNSGFSGLLFTPEVRNSKSAEDWLRRIQATCMSPVAMINAWADGTKPWSFPEVADDVKNVIELRIRLLPYIYTTFAKYHDDGTPPFRSLVLENDFQVKGGGEQATKLDSNNNPYSEALSADIRDQYMMGDSLMVCPFFAGEEEREIILPSGRWYDFHSGKLAGEAEIITLSRNYRDIPMFVRDGAIIPMLESARFPDVGADTPLEIRLYGEKEGMFDLYDDDGESFDYERDVYCWIRVAMRRGETGSWDITSGNYPTRYQPRNWVFM